jgi:cell division protein FtsZ
MGSGSARGPDRAREAAEAAISSPLLEDINLSGARGILVNVTGGENLSIGEFNQVGEAVKHCASEDATVVIGTVIDPEMGDAIRVTVVATGLGQPAVRQQPVMRVVQPAVAVARPPRGTDTREPPVETGTGGDAYGGYDQPAWMRKRAVGDQLTDGGDDSRFDLLDVPAFLRRQAD